eukprot:CAMPEP_0178433726 /NCGR_PEP_ID=MMETSP0689_2-20121128/33057_1 /TAXON_ID=160604 /ORGANISM="Amphidinium massartii, Strain CS-259" /LENGTH=211 /DNA_ID=CAMNT_0020055769 /DNA_START=97 /DNA_END=732 /DNA_ORIENTATION=+
MAPRSQTRPALRNALAVSCAAAVLVSQRPSASFVSPLVPNFFAPRGAPPGRSGELKLPRRSFEAGKVNRGTDSDNPAEGDQAVAAVPDPVMECDQACVVAIEECLEDGCSIEAMQKLDAILAGDEQNIQEIVHAIEEKKHTEVAPGVSPESVYWLENYLQRSGMLRAQIHALKGAEVDRSFLEQMIKAASIAFGGGRKGDYPKVGVSPYSV